jgi:23S rRNA (uracil1939-C5)-methyltransferase
MSRTKPKIVELEITGLAHKGAAVGKTDDGMVVFVRDAVPGDRVKALLNKKRKGTWHGYLEEIIRYSDQRTKAVCKHFGICGGCSWQNLAYTEQLHQKEKMVRDSLTRIGKVANEIIEEILPAPFTEYYRNKLEYTFSKNRWLTKVELENAGTALSNNALGFHRPGIFHKIVDIEKCYLQNDYSNHIRNFVREHAIRESLEFYDIKNQKGFLRNLIIKSNTKNEIMCIIVFGYEDEDASTKLIKDLISKFPEIISLHQVINTKKNDSYFDLSFQKVYGEDYLLENLDHAKFLIGPKSFFQTNPKQTAALYGLVAEYASLKGTETVYDWYCGVGSIGIYLANNANKIIGVDEIAEAIHDAEQNAKVNELDNCHFYITDAKDADIDGIIEKHGRPDVLIVDPPRAGMHPNVINQIIHLQPSKLIYVSCNPATQARDILLLSTHYKIEKIKPVDMFPHTNHVESVALLSLLDERTV